MNPPRRKSGGRAGRHAMRLNTDKLSPVRAGFEGGKYKPLSDYDVKRIHETALKVLENIGIGDPIPLLVELATEKGCWLNDKGRLCFPKAFIEDIIAKAAKKVMLYARDSKHDLDISGKRVHFGTGGAAISVLDFETGSYRASTLTDVYDFARLTDQLEHVHWYTRSVIATELPDPLELDINTAYALVAGTKNTSVQRLLWLKTSPLLCNSLTLLQVAKANLKNVLFVNSTPARWSRRCVTGLTPQKQLSKP